MREIEVPGWDGATREDGMTVASSIEGFVVFPPDTRPTITECPCCDKPFKTARAAKLVADAVYPRATLPVGPLFPVERKPE